MTEEESILTRISKLESGFTKFEYQSLDNNSNNENESESSESEETGGSGDSILTRISRLDSGFTEFDVHDDELPSGVTVDSELSLTSENPVQNKVITSALSTKETYSPLHRKIHIGTSQTPSPTLGEDGDIYICYEV